MLSPLASALGMGAEKFAENEFNSRPTTKTSSETAVVSTLNVNAVVQARPNEFLIDGSLLDVAWLAPASFLTFEISNHRDINIITSIRRRMVCVRRDDVDPHVPDLRHRTKEQ